MDFYVYDNIYTYNKKFPTNKQYPEANLKVKQIMITEKGAFWFETDFKKEAHNVNVNAPYLHLHKGLQSVSKMQFNKEPYFIDTQKIIYNPKENRIEIKAPGSWFWNKPIFIKNTKGNYYGVDKPKNKIKTLGDWIYDYHNTRMHIILNYYPGYSNFKYQVS